MKRVLVFLPLLFLFSGCAQRKANPIPVYLSGDENRSCASLKTEVVRLKADIRPLVTEIESSEFKNRLMEVGAFVAIPLVYAIDLNDAEKTEIEALQRRHNRLLLIARNKGCEWAKAKDEYVSPSDEQAGDLKTRNRETQ